VYFSFLCCVVIDQDGDLSNKSERFIFFLSFLFFPLSSAAIWSTNMYALRTRQLTGIHTYSMFFLLLFFLFLKYAIFESKCTYIFFLSLKTCKYSLSKMKIFFLYSATCIKNMTSSLLRSRNTKNILELHDGRERERGRTC